MVADVSETGMRIILDYSLPIGSAVTVLLANHRVMARVVYCAKDQGAFALGLWIDATSDALRSLCRQALVDRQNQEGIPSVVAVLPSV